MVDAEDWRWDGQDEYLMGVVLYHKAYRRYSERWDHDHCEFCWAKLMEKGEGVADVFHEGYATEGDRQWICSGCFADFREQFAWKVIEVDQQA